MVRVFLPRPQSSTNDLLTRIHAGDKITATGLLTQYAPQPPFNSDFQIMLASPADVKVSGTGIGLTPILVVAGLAILAAFLAIWWIRDHRIHDPSSMTARCESSTRCAPKKLNRFAPPHRPKSPRN